MPTVTITYEASEDELFTASTNYDLIDLASTNVRCHGHWKTQVDVDGDSLCGWKEAHAPEEEEEMEEENP